KAYTRVCFPLCPVKRGTEGFEGAPRGIDRRGACSAVAVGIARDQDGASEEHEPTPGPSPTGTTRQRRRRAAAGAAGAACRRARRGVDAPHRGDGGGSSGRCRGVHPDLGERAVVRGGGGPEGDLREERS